MDDTSIRISKAQNGYAVDVTDPDIRKDNRNADLVKGGKHIPWRDPNVKFVFKTPAEVAKFITDNIDKMFPDGDEYSTSFSLAAKDNSK